MGRLVFSIAAALIILVGACSGSDTPAASPDVTVAPTPEAPASPEPSATTVPAEPTPTPEPQRPQPVSPQASTVAALLALDRPVVAGHAGGDQSWPHSTMYGFTQAALAGVDVLEMDVQLTGDGVLVVQHDDTVTRTTEASHRVRDLTYAELQELDNGYWWSQEWPSRDLPAEAYEYRGIRTAAVSAPAGFGPDDFRVETFRHVAETFPDHVLDIEIKIPSGDDGEDDIELAKESARVLAEEIHDLAREESVIVVSFNDDVTAAFGGFAPTVATSPGTSAMLVWLGTEAGLAPTDVVLQIPPEFQGAAVLSDEFLRRAHAANLAVWVWANDAATQENAAFYQQLVDMGVDGLIAGRPAEAVEQLFG